MDRFIILISVLFVSIETPVQARDRENVLILPDRVWLCTSWERDEHTAKYMKFMESKDFKDKTYTRVSTIKKVMWDYGMINVRIEDDIDETEAWMREENGKIYLLLDGWYPYPYSDSDSPNDPVEGLLYDFNSVAGSTYGGIAQYRPYENDPGWYYEGWYHVSAVGTETVGDEEVKSWYVRFGLTEDEDMDKSSKAYHIVEGIGIVEYGGLYYLETYDHTSGFNFYNGFECCMDLNGNIIYPKDYNGELPGGGLTSAVEGIPAEHPDAGTTLYDILGRRIANPAPGQRYIQGGKKHIAK